MDYGELVYLSFNNTGMLFLTQESQSVIVFTGSTNKNNCFPKNSVQLLFTEKALSAAVEKLFLEIS